MSAAHDTSKSQRTDNNYNTTMDQNHNHNQNQNNSTGRPSRNHDFRGTPNNQSRNSSGNPALPGSSNNNNNNAADRFNHRNANRPQKDHNAETDGPLTQLDVYSPSGDTLFVIPVSDIIHLPPDFSARTKGHNQHNNRKLTLCPRYMVHSYSEHLSEKEELLRAQQLQQQDKDSNKDTSSSLSEIECPNGDSCHHVHASLKRASVNNDIHINYAYKALEHVKYERFPEFEENGTTPKILRVAPPNETHPFIEIPAQYCLKTKAFTGNRRITSHCAHYYYNRICNRGSECFFIHAISFEVDKEIQEEQELLHEKKKILSQKLQEELEKNRAVRGGGASRGGGGGDNVAAPSVTKEDANIYLADCEDGYILRAWGRTQPFRDYDPNADHSRSRKKRKHRRRGRGGGGSDRSGSDSSRTSSVSSTNTSRSDRVFQSNSQNGLFGQTTQQQPPAQQQLFGSATMNTSGNNTNNKNLFSACINNNNTPQAPVIGDDHQQQHSSQSRQQHQQPTTPNSRGKMSSLAAAFTNTPKQNEEEIREQRSLSRRESARQTPVHHSHNEGFTVPPPMSLQNQQQQPGGGMFGAALVHNNNNNNMEMNSPNRNGNNNNNTSSGPQSFHNTPKFGPQSSPSTAPNATIQQGGPFGAAMPTNYSNDNATNNNNNMMTSPTGNSGPVVPPPSAQAGYTGQRGVSSTNSGRESPNVAYNSSGQTTPNRRGNNPYMH